MFALLLSSDGAGRSGLGSWVIGPGAARHAPKEGPWLRGSRPVGMPLLPVVVFGANEKNKDPRGAPAGAWL